MVNTFFEVGVIKISTKCCGTMAFYSSFILRRTGDQMQSVVFFGAFTHVALGSEQMVPEPNYPQ
jgi:hypothetical protein